MTLDEQYMKRCLALAAKGQGFVAPNPMVGCVIVHDETVIGEGYHEQFGNAHAEVNAIQKVIDKSQLKEATLYVNLEPCAHFGKTPPCADLLIKHQLKKVVIGCRDSYKEVAGKGIEKLRKAGIEVSVGILEKDCLNLNRRFFTYHEKKRPYVILKWAQSADGFIDIERNQNQKGIVWITSPETKKLTHQWRHEETSILVGWHTIANDNPHLTCREFDGKNPIRIVIDPHLRLDYNACHIGNSEATTYVLTAKSVRGNDHLQFVLLEDFSVQSLLSKLHELQIQSVIIEGGKTTLNHFLDSNTWDEARVLVGDTKLGRGASAPQMSKKPSQEYTFNTDRILIFEHA